MKTLITFFLSLIVCGNIHAQTTIYLDTINSAGSNWTLNTSDIGGVTTGAPNKWVINNWYTGGTISIVTVANTPDEPAGVTGYPESYYLHIDSKQGETNGFYNCNFNATGNHSYFAAMNTSFSTIGYTNVNLSFWWICNGDNVTYGQVYYRTSATGSWVQISSANTSPVALDSYNVSASWVQAVNIHVDSFDNKGFLQLGYRFKQQGAAGNDPAFGVDDIKITGTPSSSPPVTSFSVTATSDCQDSSIIATSTTPGTVDSVRWSVTPTTGATINTPTATATSITFATAGTYSVTLTAYSGGLSDAATNVITVIPTPSPVIVNNPATHTLSVTGAYTAYQWASGSPIPSAIAGATNSSYTYSVTGTYYVGVDSDGCQGYSPVPFVYSTTGVANINNNMSNKYWLATSGGSLNLYAAQALDEPLTINIYDATGRSTLNDVWENGNDTKQLSSAFFPPGMYIVRLSNNKTSIVFRWVK